MHDRQIGVTPVQRLPAALALTAGGSVASSGTVGIVADSGTADIVADSGTADYVCGA